MNILVIDNVVNRIIIYLPNIFLCVTAFQLNKAIKYPVTYTQYNKQDLNLLNQPHKDKFPVMHPPFVITTLPRDGKRQKLLFYNISRNIFLCS